MSAKTKAGEHVVTTRLINSRRVPIRFSLEPWGEEFEMPPAAIFQIVGRGPCGDGLEVAIDDKQITVWGWPGSVVTLFHEGAELGAGRGNRSRVPPMPPIQGTQVTQSLRGASPG